MKILLADDNADARMMLGTAFRAFNHTVILATNGAEAVHAAQIQSFDAIVLDIGMPIMNGWEATKIIRQIAQATVLPIILFTGYDQFFDQDRAKAVGATLLLHKPFDPVTLVKLVEAYVAMTSEKASSDNH
jgi:CheY-like chemotaxis protein